MSLPLSPQREAVPSGIPPGGRSPAFLSPPPACSINTSSILKLDHKSTSVYVAPVKKAVDQK
jgi:hypothetical protein